MLIQCIGGNWATSRTFCKKIGARNNVLTIKNTYKRAEHCGGNNHHSKGLILELSLVPIRASVDALCRDDPSEISRDTRTKCLQTRRESLARPSKHTNNNF